LDEAPLKLDENKGAFFVRLRAVHEGREAYREYLDAMNEDLLAEYLVPDKEYIRVRKSIYRYLKDNRLTLNQLFEQIDREAALTEEFRLRNRDFYEEVDRYNQNIQNQVDQVEALTPQKLSRLQEMFSVEYNTLEHEDQVFYIYYKITNHREEPVTNYTVAFSFFDEEDREILSVTSQVVNSYFTGSRQESTQVSAYYHREDYRVLAQWDWNKPLRIEGKVLALVTAQKSYPDFGELQSASTWENQHYQSPEKPFGDGPYTSEELAHRVEELEFERDREIAQAIPELRGYRRFYYDFYDSQRAYRESHGTY
ncbi:MAG: hypothetical protein PQJ60_09510, partial [Spirochaetales bacterium]|nr:hypothetical protein [Spirochaetales bacterium]